MFKKVGHIWCRTTISNSSWGTRGLVMLFSTCRSNWGRNAILIWRDTSTTWYKLCCLIVWCCIRTNNSKLDTKWSNCGEMLSTLEGDGSPLPRNDPSDLALQLNSQFVFSITALFEFIWIMDLTFIWIMWIKHNNLSYKMTEAIRKENIIEMPDGSDMIA